MGKSILAGFLVLLACAVPAAAQTGRNVLLVVNRASEASEEIATYYAGKRGVPDAQILRLNLPLDEEISRTVYQAGIEEPIRAWLTANAAQDRILYIVLTKGVPIRVAGTVGARGTVSSVDSELALVYQRLSAVATSATGSIPNPYFADSALAKSQPFSHKTHNIYLVARLDGYTVDDVKALIDRGVAPSREGRVLLDARFEIVESPGNRWLEAASNTLKARDGWSDRVELDAGSNVLSNQTNVLGLYSWGSNDRTAGTRHLNLGFVPGALAAQFVSTDARTFQEPPADWTVNGTPFRGSHQSLVGDLIRDGITGVAGHVAEPYLNAAIRPDILFPAYASGFNLVESFYLAMPVLSWQTVVIGDPLCAPFRTTEPAAADLDPPIDDVTLMPEFLSKRSVDGLVSAGVKPEAARWMARADVLQVRGDRKGAREALDRVTSLDPAFLTGHRALALLHEANGDVDLAIERYRQIIAIAPNDGLALNNLAYSLATNKNSPGEALPFARRAYAAGKNNASYTDTLAWVYHLLGQNADAEPLITAAVGLAPNVPEIQVHAAVILLARGRAEQAKAALDRALRINPKLADREDVVAIRQKLSQ